MRLRFSETGQRLTLTCILVALWGALFQDYLLVGLGVMGVCFLVYMYITLRSQLVRLPGQVKFNPSTLNASFTAGSEYNESVLVENSGEGVPSIKMPVGELKPAILLRGEHPRSYRFKPSLAANYQFKEISAYMVESFNLVEGETEIGFQAMFRVYPRVFSVALDALRYLEGQGLIGAGEQVSKMKGRGYEYADSREYVAGDDLRQIDWKATARLGRMIVKENYTEGSGAIHIIYDRRVSDPVSGDVLAAEYLRSVLSFAERSWVIGLTVLDGRQLVNHYRMLYPSIAVSVALKHVLDSRRGELMSYFDVLDPAYNTRLKSLLMDSVPDSGSDFNVLRDEMYDHRYGGIIYITSLTGNPSGLMELSYVARASKTRFVALEPCKPWRYIDLEDAYRVYRQYDKVNRSLHREGIPVAVSLNEAQEKLVDLMYL